jgi:hypothetical protein
MIKRREDCLIVICSPAMKLFNAKVAIFSLTNRNRTRASRKNSRRTGFGLEARTPLFHSITIARALLLPEIPSTTDGNLGPIRRVRLQPYSEEDNVKKNYTDPWPKQTIIPSLALFWAERIVQRS